MKDFVQLIDETFICTLKCTDLIVLLKMIAFFFVFIYNKDAIENVKIKNKYKKAQKLCNQMTQSMPSNEQVVSLVQNIRVG